MSPQDDNLFFIGQIAKLSGLSVKTVRYYEDIGLVNASRRTKGGFRQFSIKVLSRLEFIKQCQSLGLSLQEIREVLSLYEQQDFSADSTKQQLENKISMLDHQIESLISLRTELKKLLSVSITR
jgi:DNA-binding transcriptional MerR regulator